MNNQWSEKFKQDWDIRIRAIRWILNLCDRRQKDGVLHRSEYASNQFYWKGEQPIVLQHPQRGVHRPLQCQFPISITTASRANRYGDHFEPDGEVFRYSYQGKGEAGSLTQIDNSFNNGLRELQKNRWPLIYFHGILSSYYLVVAPVFIIDDNPDDQDFGIIWGESMDFYESLAYQNPSTPAAISDRSLILDIPDLRPDQIQERSVKIRLAQGSFREKILRAYNDRCALCRLNHPQLLDAAHITPVSEKGNYSVPNGLSLCKLHHAAYDKHFLGITPDFEIKIRESLMDERDGPVLQYAIKGLHGEKIHLPKQRNDRPDQDALASRYEQFERYQSDIIGANL
uniref:HNH nuclease domain-containing protein n=1 Tax=Amphimedon queenslandica TaxID=400682 RepID=A0A1X7T8G0_AMPQE